MSVTLVLEISLSRAWAVWFAAGGLYIVKPLQRSGHRDGCSSRLQ